MRLIRVSYACFFCLFFPLLGEAATLSNDVCAGATVIPGAGPFPYFTDVIPDISGASIGGDPDFAECGFLGLTNSVWFKFSPTATALYRISTCSDTETTVDDTTMAVYRTSGSTCGTFTLVGCGDDTCGLRAAVTNTLTSGRTYFIVVWKFALGGSSGGNALQLRISRPTVPTNDVCSGATTVPSAGPFPHLTPVTEVTLATSAGDPPPPSCQPEVSNSVWYKFRPAEAGIYRFSDCSETATTAPDTVLGLYTSSSGACGGTFTELTCSDDDCNTRSSLAWPLATNVTYYAVLSAYSGGSFLGESDMQLRVSKVTFPAPGAVLVDAGLTRAELRATVVPNEGNTLMAFQWGTTTNYGGLTVEQSVTGGSNAVEVTDTLSGLLPNTVYHVRAVATNEAGVVFGPDFVFQTTPLPRITSYQFLPNGDFRVQFAAPTNEVYHVEGSLDLIEWVDLGPPDAVGDFLLQFDDPGANETRFYRIASP